MIKKIHAFALIALGAIASCQFSPGTSGDDDDQGLVDAPLAPADDASTSSPDGPDTRADGGRPPGPGPGIACDCDADCPAEGANAGVCVYGICMTRATTECGGGEQTGCPTGSRCWHWSDSDDLGPLCWPDCAAHNCAGVCDADGSCAPTENSDCDPTCGSGCSCTATSCSSGETCVAGECQVPMGGGPGPGPGPACAGLPPRDCTGTTCGQLVSFNPRANSAWDDYPINGETATNQYRSYLRKDLQMLLAYATSKVACKTAGWTGGNGGPLGLGDMSEANGAIPGTSINEPGHPENTHVNGYDIDLAYYQSNTANNYLRPICTHMSGGTDQYHCVAPPDKLDVWRDALFLGFVFESSRVRVIGVDGQAGQLLMNALNQLCDSGWLEATACNNISLAYEVTNMNLGWFQFHHHHQHISLNRTSLVELPDIHGPLCLSPDCRPLAKGRAGHTPGVHELR